MRRMNLRRGFVAAAVLALLAGFPALLSGQPISPGNLVGSAPPPPPIPPTDYPTGRLSLVATNAATGTSTTGAGTIFYVPWTGNQLPLWNGSNFQLYTFPVLQNVLAQSGPGIAAAAVAAASCYDMYVFFQPTLQQLSLYRSPAWTNCNARGAPNGQVFINGLIVNSADMVNGPAAGFGVYVGSIATDGGAGTVSWTLPSGGSGYAPAGGAALNIWNEFNRVPLTFTGVDNGAAYNYSSGTIRQARNSTAAQITYMKGHANDGLDPQISHQFAMTTAAVASAFANKGFGTDQIVAFSSGFATCKTAAAVANVCGGTIQWAPPTGGVVSAGKHFVAILEQGDGANNTSFDSTPGFDSYVFTWAN